MRTIPKGSHDKLRMFSDSKISSDGALGALIRGGTKKNWTVEEMSNVKRELELLQQSIRSRREYYTYQRDLVENWERQQLLQQSQQRKVAKQNLDVAPSSITDVDIIGGTGKTKAAVAAAEEEVVSRASVDGGASAATTTTAAASSAPPPPPEVVNGFGVGDTSVVQPVPAGVAGTQDRLLAQTTAPDLKVVETMAIGPSLETSNAKKKTAAMVKEPVSGKGGPTVTPDIAEPTAKRQKMDASSPTRIRLPLPQSSSAPTSQTAETPFIDSTEKATNIESQPPLVEPTTAKPVTQPRQGGKKTSKSRKSSSKKQGRPSKQASSKGRQKRKRQTVIDEDEEDEEYKPSPERETAATEEESDEDFIMEDHGEEEYESMSEQQTPDSGASIPKRLTKTKNLQRGSDVSTDFLDEEDDLDAAANRASAASNKHGKKGRTKRKGKVRSGAAAAPPERAASIPDLEPFPEDEHFGFSQYLATERHNLLPHEQFWKHINSYFAPLTSARLQLLALSRQYNEPPAIPPVGMHYLTRWAREDSGLSNEATSLSGNGSLSYAGMHYGDDSQHRSGSVTPSSFRRGRGASMQSTPHPDGGLNGFDDQDSISRMMLDLNSAGNSFPKNSLTQRLLCSLVEERDVPTAFIDGTLDTTLPISSLFSEEIPKKKKKGRPRIHKPPELPATGSSSIDPNELFLLQKLIDEIDVDQGHIVAPQQSSVTTQDYNPGMISTLDERIVHELRNVSVFPMDTSVSDINQNNREDDEICSEIRALQIDMQQQAARNDQLKSRIREKLKLHEEKDRKRFKILMEMKKLETEFNRYLHPSGKKKSGVTIG